MTPQIARTRAKTVVVGRQDYLSVVLRLIGMELYKIRRRTMSKILSIIALTSIFIVFVTLFFLSLQESARGSLNFLSVPDSLNIAVQVTLTPFTILIIILIGSIVGGEYSLGTIRLLLTRGPSRTQFYLAKIGAALVCSALGVLSMAGFGMVLAFVLHLIVNEATPSNFFSPGWLEHACLYLLIAIFSWFTYALIAIFFSVLGRSSVAGIVGGLVWFLLETLISQFFQVVGGLVNGPVGDVLRGVPDYLIGNNLGALQQNQAHYLFNSEPATISDLHALIVLAIYILIFSGLAWRVNQRRDVTN